MKPTPVETVRAYVEAINAHEIATITNLMTHDHEFIDSLGATEVGKAKMRESWIAYFFMIPDFAIDISEMFFEGPVVVVLGKASGTVAVGRQLPAANKWKMPMAVRAETRDGLIARWQVFADNEPVRRILSAS